MTYFFTTWTKFFVLLTPFFALSMFLLYTTGFSVKAKRSLAIKVTLAVLLISLVLFFAGQGIFNIVGVTIDSFRVGAGILLFLSAVSLVQGELRATNTDRDVAVVPLAVPIIVGPATTGAILIMGAEIQGGMQRLQALGAMALAIFSIGLILLSAAWIEKLVRPRGIVILSKLTGLFLAALASQMVLEGIRHIWQN